MVNSGAIETKDKFLWYHLERSEKAIVTKVVIGLYVKRSFVCRKFFLNSS